MMRNKLSEEDIEKYERDFATLRALQALRRTLPSPPKDHDLETLVRHINVPRGGRNVDTPYKIVEQMRAYGTTYLEFSELIEGYRKRIEEMSAQLPYTTNVYGDTVTLAVPFRELGTLVRSMPQFMWGEVPKDLVADIPQEYITIDGAEELRRDDLCVSGKIIINGERVDIGKSVRTGGAYELRFPYVRSALRFAEKYDLQLHPVTYENLDLTVGLDFSAKNFQARQDRLYSGGTIPRRRPKRIGLSEKILLWGLPLAFFSGIYFTNRGRMNHEAAAITAMICDREPALIDDHLYFNPMSPSAAFEGNGHYRKEAQGTVSEYVLFEKGGLVGTQNSVSVLDVNKDGLYTPGIDILTFGHHTGVYKVNESSFDDLNLFNPMNRFMDDVAQGNCDDFEQGKYATLIESQHLSTSSNSWVVLKRISLADATVHRGPEMTTIVDNTHAPWKIELHNTLSYMIVH